MWEHGHFLSCCHITASDGLLMQRMVAMFTMHCADWGTSERAKISKTKEKKNKFSFRSRRKLHKTAKL